MLGACNTCVKLQSRVTSSRTTVNSWMILFYFSLLLLLLFLLLLLLLFCLFACFFFLFFLFHLLFLLLLACLLMCAFKFALLLSLFWVVFVFVFFLVCLFSFMKGNAVFISMGAGTGWSYNLLVSKLTFLILELYINYSVAGKFRCN